MTPIFYYPGCSLKASASEYDVSTRAFLKAMGFELVEINDWTCCGATAATGTNDWLALALPARNLALAEKQAELNQVVVPCSACYLNLKRVEEDIIKFTTTLDTLNTLLELENLRLSRRIRVLHLLDLLTRQMDVNRFKDMVSRPLNDLKIAPYYGCQAIRPYRLFDDPEAPVSMEKLLRGAGAKIFPWDMGPKCCGASHMNTKMELGLELSGAILAAAKGADAIATVCPMCHMNLSAYQRKISAIKKMDLSIPVFYLPQLLGLSIGLKEEELGLKLKNGVSSCNAILPSICDTALP